MLPETIKDERGNLFFKYHTFKFREDMKREAERLQHLGFKTYVLSQVNTDTLYSNPKADY
jgi:hypothetical protein